MRRSQQAFSESSKQTQSSNAKDELSSTASINASSTTLIPSSKLLASKPRDCTLKREQNSCYEHDNGLKPRWIQKHFSPRWARGKRYQLIGRIKLFSHKDRSRTRFFTSSKARSSSLSFPSKARKRWLQSWNQVIFLEKDV